jgi:hypothetical protein
MTDEPGRSALLRPSLPAGFIRWRLALGPGEERSTEEAEWADAIVLIESGVVEVHCRSGGWTTFRAGDLLALSCLPLRAIRNAGEEPAEVVAVRRRVR